MICVAAVLPCNESRTCFSPSKDKDPPWSLASATWSKLLEKAACISGKLSQTSPQNQPLQLLFTKTGAFCYFWCFPRVQRLEISIMFNLSGKAMDKFVKEEEERGNKTRNQLGAAASQNDVNWRKDNLIVFFFFFLLSHSSIWTCLRTHEFNLTIQEITKKQWLAWFRDSTAYGLVWFSEVEDLDGRMALQSQDVVGKKVVSTTVSTINKNMERE